MNPAVFVFVQKGCSACEEYMPRFEAVRREVPGATVGVYDLARPGHATDFARKLDIRATPTTIVMTRGGALKRHVGALGNAQIRQLLSAVR